MMRIAVEHRTTFRYDTPITDAVMEFRLRPAVTGLQSLVKFELDVTPHAPTPSYVDSFGNTVHGWNYGAAHQQIDVVARSTVVTGKTADGSPNILPMERLRYLQFGGPVIDLPGVRTLAAGLPDDPIRALDALTSRIHESFRYQKNVTSVGSTVADVLALGAGVCQDFTHLWIAAARSCGLPARYVSGYLYNPPDGDAVGAFASHAWAEAWVAGAGWVGRDPTNDTAARERHISVAFGRDYRDVAPTRGVYRGNAAESLDVAVSTIALPDAPTTNTG